MPFWDQMVDEIAPTFPEVALQRQHVDALAAMFVLRPETFDVLVASNLFGDPSPTSAPRSSAASASPRPPTSTQSAFTRRCSSRSTAQRPTSPGAGSPTRSGRSGRA
jgi:tartrate dehydrogenase/decarboxylase/D-malate dehydrogenase